MGGLLQFLIHSSDLTQGIVKSIKTGEFALSNPTTTDSNRKFEYSRFNTKLFGKCLEKKWKKQCLVQVGMNIRMLVYLEAELLAKSVEDWARQQKSMNVLDIASGPGAFGYTFAKHYPQAKVTAFDFPNVIPITQKHVEKQGVASQVT